MSLERVAVAEEVLEHAWAGATWPLVRGGVIGVIRRRDERSPTGNRGGVPVAIKICVPTGEYRPPRDVGRIHPEVALGAYGRRCTLGPRCHPVQGGQPRVVFVFTTDGERIVGIDSLADPSRLAQMEVDVL